MLRIHPDLYREMLLQRAEYQLDRELIVALWWVESRLNPLAVGDANMSAGLGQLYQGGAGAGYSLSALLEVSTNARLSAQYLAKMISETGTVEDGLSAYNQGLQGWRERGIAANRDYVQAILNMRDKLKAEGLGQMGWPELYYSWGNGEK